MARIFDGDQDAPAALQAAETALADGGLVAMPTDTVYGVAARPDVPGATDRVFEAKRRPRDLTLPVLVAGTADADEVAALDDRAAALAARFWPGGLTMILRRTERSSEWDLGSERDTVGVRVPAHGLAIALLARTGPLAVTSANVSGEPTPRTCEGVAEALGEALSVVMCARINDGETPSTIVDLTGWEPRVVRAGAIPPDEVLTLLKET